MSEPIFSSNSNYKGSVSEFIKQEKLISPSNSKKDPKTSYAGQAGLDLPRRTMFVVTQGDYPADRFTQDFGRAILEKNDSGEYVFEYRQGDATGRSAIELEFNKKAREMYLEDNSRDYLLNKKENIKLSFAYKNDEGKLSSLTIIVNKHDSSIWSYGVVEDILAPNEQNRDLDRTHHFPPVIDEKPDKDMLVELKQKIGSKKINSILGLDEEPGLFQNGKLDVAKIEKLKESIENTKKYQLYPLPELHSKYQDLLAEYQDLLTKLKMNENNELYANVMKDVAQIELLLQPYMEEDAKRFSHEKLLQAYAEGAVNLKKVESLFEKNIVIFESQKKLLEKELQNVYRSETQKLSSEKDHIVLENEIADDVLSFLRKERDILQAKNEDVEKINEKITDIEKKQVKYINAVHELQVESELKNKNISQLILPEKNSINYNVGEFNRVLSDAKQSYTDRKIQELKRLPSDSDSVKMCYKQNDKYEITRAALEKEKHMLEEQYNRLNKPELLDKIYAVSKQLLVLEKGHYQFLDKKIQAVQLNQALCEFSNGVSDAIKGLPGEGVKYLNRILRRAEKKTNDELEKINNIPESKLRNKLIHTFHGINEQKELLREQKSTREHELKQLEKTDLDSRTLEEKQSITHKQSEIIAVGTALLSIEKAEQSFLKNNIANLRKIPPSLSVLTSEVAKFNRVAARALQNKIIKNEKMFVYDKKSTWEEIVDTAKSIIQSLIKSLVQKPHSENNPVKPEEKPIVKPGYALRRTAAQEAAIQTVRKLHDLDPGVKETRPKPQMR